MRALTFLVLCGLMLAAPVPAHADVRSYCEAYARDQADHRLSGGAILGAPSNLTAAEKKERNTLALADCLTLYTPKLRIEPVTAEIPAVNIAREKPVTAVQPKPPMRAKAKTAVPAKQKAVAAPKLRKTVIAKVPAKQNKSVSKTAASVGDPWKTFDDQTKILSPR